jgi:hypothetical protein
MDIVRLRKMTLKSKFTDGKYKGCSVEKVVSTNPQYIQYVYYNYPKIDFSDDVFGMMKMSIKRINKPGIDVDYFYSITRGQKTVADKTEAELLKMINGIRMNGGIVHPQIIALYYEKKARKQDKENVNSETITKKQLQAINHGKIKKGGF